MSKRLKANATNFLRQADESAKWFAESVLVYQEYARLFPDKMTIIQGEDITIKDITHFTDWKKQRGQP
jgi:hypothetical protein